jgi:hypothetical protein
MTRQFSEAPQVLVNHPFGNPNVYQAALGLHLQGCLASFAIYGPWARRAWTPSRNLST